MNLRDLLAIQALVTTGTTKGAAMNIGVSQPTVSRAVVEMEAYFGRQLFARQAGRLVPTAAALRVSDGAVEISTMLQKMKRDLNLFKSEQTLTVGIAVSQSNNLVRHAIRRFRFLQPGICIKIVTMGELALSRALEVGDLDVLLSPQPHPECQVEIEQLLSMKICCVMRRDHRLAIESVLTPELVSNESIVLVNSSHQQIRKIETVFRDAGATLDARLEAASISMALSFVEAGLGIALCTLDESDLWPGIVARPFAPTLECMVFSIARSNGPMLHAARQFCRLIRRAKEPSEVALCLAESANQINPRESANVA